MEEIQYSSGRMSVMSKSRRKYPKEFKLEAVRLILEGRPVTEVAEDLGVDRSLLYTWKKRALADGEAAFPGNGKTAMNELETEVRELRRELSKVKQDREILKKAAAYFAQNQD